MCLLASFFPHSIANSFKVMGQVILGELYLLSNRVLRHLLCMLDGYRCRTIAYAKEGKASSQLPRIQISMKQWPKYFHFQCECVQYYVYSRFYLKKPLYRLYRYFFKTHIHHSWVQNMYLYIQIYGASWAWEKRSMGAWLMISGLRFIILNIHYSGIIRNF